jgi:predicted outer membrane repeat protein
LDTSSSAGTTTEVKQNEQITQSSFTSTAAYKPKVGSAVTKTRTSNYGTDFDLNMKATKGSSPTGTVGYYVNPGMATTSLGAIQGGINAAETGDAVNAAAGTYKENVKIDKSLTVNGNGAGYTIVDGNKADSVFTFGRNNPNIDVTLSGMTVQNGNALLGGGIRNYGSLTMNDIKLTGNHATYGGGIANFGTMTQNGGSIDNNAATQDGGGIANFHGKAYLNHASASGNTANDGGGIYNEASSTLTLNGTSISYNTAKQGGGGIYNWGKILQTGGSIDHNTANSGGGIYSDGASVVTLNDGSLSHNTANYYGGGIYTWGTFTQNGGSISYNTAKVAGGGIYNDAGDDHAGMSTLNSVSVDHNNAVFGGGIYDDNYATTKLKSSVISSNSADIGGGIFNDLGCLLTQNGGSISYNTAESGGGIYSDEGKVIINSGSIDHNKATVYNGGGIFMDMYGSLVVNGGSISDNTAAMYGGGVMNVGTFNLYGGSIDHNQAGIDGGGVQQAAGSLNGYTALVHDNILANTGRTDNISS